MELPLGIELSIPAVQCGYQFPPSNSDKHLALPCEVCVVKGTISRRKRALDRGWRDDFLKGVTATARQLA